MLARLIVVLPGPVWGAVVHVLVALHRWDQLMACAQYRLRARYPEVK